jgi:hypothetical protein
MPDGEHVAYRDTDLMNISYIPLDGGDPRRLTAFTSFATSGMTVGFSWSRDGTRLARLVRTVSDDIVLLSLSE